MSEKKQDEENQFKFNFSVKYEPEVEARFYAWHNFNNIPEHALQNRGENEAVCLLCNAQFTKTQLNNDFIHAHFNTHTENWLAFDFYHKLFLDGPVELQKEHGNYLPLNEGGVQFSGTTSEYFSNAVGKYYVCLLCRQIFRSEKTWTAHFQTKQHQSCLTLDRFTTVHRYHNAFKGCENIKLYFIPHFGKKLRCLLCHTPTKLVSAPSHFPCMFLTKKDDFYDKRIDFQALRDEFYQKHFTNEQFYYENVGIWHKCLICKQKFPKKHAFLMHCEDRKHLKHLAKRQNLDLLASFLSHRDQCDVLTDFYPGYYCMWCRKKFKGHDLEIHRSLCTKRGENPPQPQQTEQSDVVIDGSDGVTTNTQQPEVEEKVSSNQENVNVSKLASNLKKPRITDGEDGGDGAEIVPGTSSQNRITSVEFVNSSLNNSHNNEASTTTTTPSSIKVAKTKKRNVKQQQQQQHKEKKPSSTENRDNIMDASSSDVENPIQKRTYGNYCLVCDANLSEVSQAKQHLTGRRHMLAYGNKYRLLIAYNQFFATMRKTPPAINFNLFDANHITCDVCMRILEWNACATHDCLKKNKMPNKLANKIYQNYSEMMYKKVFFLRAMRKTEEMLNVKIPLCHITSGPNLKCLLCGFVFFNNLKKWQQHLYKSHVSKDRRPLFERLEVLDKYHTFWESQSVENQVVQILYYPIDNTHLRYDNEEITYEQVFDHFETVKHYRHNEQVEFLQNRIKYQQTMEQINGNRKAKKKNGVSKTIEHKIVVSIPNPGLTLNAANLEKIIPQYLRYNLDFLQFQPADDGDDSTTPTIICTACNAQLPGDDFVKLQHHLLDDTHYTAVGKQHQHRYTCIICDATYDRFAWLEHVTSTFHTNTVMKLIEKTKEKDPNRAATMKEYECITCRLIFFGDLHSVMEHKSKHSVDTILYIDNLTFSDEVREILESRTHFDEFCNGLVDVNERFAEDDKAVVAECLLELERTLNQTYPECRAYAFGSRAAGIGNKTSDLDIFIAINPETYNISPSPKHIDQIITKTKAALNKNSAKFPSKPIQAIRQARTPIIKAFYKPLTLDFDLSFCNGLSVENTKFIKLCVDMQPVVKRCLLFIKQFRVLLPLKLDFTSYAMNLMFIFYLQTIGGLLSVEKLRELTGDKFLIIDGWMTIDYDAKTVEALREDCVKLDDDAYSLVKGFFAYYKDFDYDKMCVCPLLGHPIKLECFADAQTLPPEMETLKTRDTRNSFKYLARVCVQDPFDFAHNVAKNLSAEQRNIFVHYCKLAHSAMKE